MNGQGIEDNAAHLLIVDDDRRIRDLLSRFLKDHGYRVTVAEHAAAARQALQTFTFDLLVLDVMMPGESGLDLARALGRAEACRSSCFPPARNWTTGWPVSLLAWTTILASLSSRRSFCSGLATFCAGRALRRRDQRRWARSISGPSASSLKREHSHGMKRRAHHGSRTGHSHGVGDRAGRGGFRQTLFELHDGVNDRTVDVHINRLRRKIEENPADPVYLQTVRGIGYRLRINR